MLQKDIEVTKTARYFQCGADERPRRLYVCTHGYGMSAKYFIRKFEVLASKGVKVIAPEGLHRFYIQGSNGRVGASWMTKEDRLNDIQDNINYLNRCIEHAGATAKTEITAFGFSQGFHTLLRWAVHTPFNISRITAWGSHFPDDVLDERYSAFFANRKIDVVLGDTDEYLTIEKMKLHLHRIKEYGIRPEFTVYNGKHKVYPEVLKSLYRND